jgi:energy-coupling factor transport system ATP-binding protein
MTIIEGKNIRYTYEGSPAAALDGVDFEVGCGEFVVILGRNGCGKSTLVKHCNALLPLQGGELTVAGLDAGDENNVWRLRRECGMVFQNPDNQFVSSLVEEDIAFGLENYGTPRNEISERVSDALRLVGMEGFERRSPHLLSGGQKQRVALAGVLAADPAIVVFDEATAMLDPAGRREILQLIRRLHEQEHRTVVMITHNVEEALYADRVYLMRGGRMLAGGEPRAILTDDALMREAGLVPPLPVRLYHGLRESGIRLKRCPLTDEELVEELCRLN